MFQASGVLVSDNAPKKQLTNPFCFAVKSVDGKTYDAKGEYHLVHCTWSTKTNVRNVFDDSAVLTNCLKNANKAGTLNPDKLPTFKIGVKFG